jgi:multidrug efflux system outer membrane protein
MRLSLTASVASTYFLLRGADREAEIIKSSAELRRRELELVSAQRRSGTATELDVARAETELASTETDLDSVRVRRESLQDTLAVLSGEPATSFEITVSTTGAVIAIVPPGIPSDLLERRPDIAAAERSLASSNARIGVAKAAFFPAISLTGGAGFESADTANLLKADSRVWSIGPSLYLPIFQGGRNKANLERARATYDESVATYRQQVLVAFKEVQEALTVARLLQEQSAAQDRAVASSERASRLAQARYKAGYTSYLDVIDAERTELSNERSAAQLTTLQLTTGVALVKALGGGWSTNGQMASPIQ